MTFENWRSEFLLKCTNKGVSAAVLKLILPYLVPLPSVLNADSTQSEARKTLQDYISLTVSEKRIAEGRDALVLHASTFEKIEVEYSVDRYVVAAIWGLESNYGTVRGDVPVLSALATLAAQGRRRAMFEAQIFAALEIIGQGIKAPNQLRGSWAGAMGHTQFMPKSYLDFAVSAHEEQPDIWSNDPADALVSSANFLTCHGWRPDCPWGLQVHVPENSNFYDLRHLPAQDGSGWAALGLRGAGLMDATWLSKLVLPGGVHSAAFLVSRNFKALLRYNASPTYAIAVGHLADRFRGGSPLDFSNGADQHGLSFSEIQFIQTQLTFLGFDTKGADGFTGPNTEVAIEAFQIASGLPADGFAGLSLLARLQNKS